MKRLRHWTYHEEKIRKAILVRDNYQCQIMGDGCLGTATTVDHIHPKAWGGTAHPSNLRAACKPCNQRKGARADAAPSRSFFSTRAHSRAPLRNLSPHNSRWSVEASDYSRKPEEA